LDYVPKSVVVVANKRDFRWEIALAAHNIQLLAVSSFRSPDGVDAIEVDGVLEVIEESLGFGTYSVADRSLRFHNTPKLPTGRVQINDPLGAPAYWIVSHSQRATWITKEFGAPDIDDGSHVQIVRSVGGRLSLKRPRPVNPYWG